jgi:hypothetical protein
MCIGIQYRGWAAGELVGFIAGDQFADDPRDYTNGAVVPARETFSKISITSDFLAQAKSTFIAKRTAYITKINRVFKK